MTDRGDVGDMAIRTLIRTASLAALIAGAGLAPMAPATAADPPHVPVIQVAASEATSRFIPLGIGKSVAIDLPADIKDVLVADPKIANAVIRSSRRVYMIGVTVGQTNIFFFDADGKQIAGFDIAVTRDLNGVRAALKQTMPDADIRIEGVGDGVMLSGSAASAAESQQAFDLASRLVGDGAKVVNGITVRGRDQVMLKVTVAEVRRDVIKQLGIDLSGTFNYGTAVVNFNTHNPFSATGQTLSNTAFAGTLKNITATLRAMDRAGVLRTLAEPNLTAISGETASFIAGGEFPIPNGLSCDTTKSPPVCQAQVDFKKFGVSLVFTPVVLSEGRISLKVMTEVSDLSSDNALDLVGARLDPDADHSLDQHPPRRDHGRNSVRRLAGVGRHDPGADQAADQRRPRPDAAADPRQPVQEPRLHQPPDRVDGDGDALHRARGGAEAAVAARRRLRRSQRSVDRTAWPPQPHLRRRRSDQTRPSSRATITANTDSSSIERDQETIDDRTPYGDRRAPRPSGAAPVGGRRSRRHAGRLLSSERVAQRDYPTDYRQRHPITLKEGERTVEVFLGRNRGGLTPSQRADVLSFAQLWRREATSGIIVDVPQGGPTDHAAADSMREIHSIFAASGVPRNAVYVRNYRPSDSVAREHQDQLFEAGRGSRPLRPVAGRPRPGPDPAYIENRPYWNLGCASQRNLAAMVDNPADLVQPRGETPAYTARRSVAIDKYRKGENPSGTYTGYDTGKISDLGK